MIQQTICKSEFVIFANSKKKKKKQEKRIRSTKATNDKVKWEGAIRVQGVALWTSVMKANGPNYPVLKPLLSVYAFWVVCSHQLRGNAEETKQKHCLCASRK